MQECGQVGGAGLQQLDALEAAALAVHLEHHQQHHPPVNYLEPGTSSTTHAKHLETGISSATSCTTRVN